MVARCLTRILTDDSELSAVFWLSGPSSSSQETKEQHTRTRTYTHTAKVHACTETHLHTTMDTHIMLSQHTVAGYICARANSKQLWSSYHNRSLKTLSVQLLCTKSFISLGPSHTINLRVNRVIVMYILLWSHLTMLDWLHYANAFC